MECDPVGTVHTPFDEPSDAPRQGALEDVVGEVELRDRYAEGLVGVEPGHETDVVWWADRADRDLLRLDRDGRGVFASRSPARPNPVCVTRVEVVAADADAGRLRVRGVDMVDGSPVIDLKAALR
ncbi:MAG: tRNA (N6-threonylcarbamoyladenosine(37)-N6)-methyltransferase TrmO [Haloferacaceae archaeon]